MRLELTWALGRNETKIPQKQKKKTLQVSRWDLYRFEYSASAHQFIQIFFSPRHYTKLHFESVLCITPSVPAEKLRKCCRVQRSKSAVTATTVQRGNNHIPAQPHPAPGSSSTRVLEELVSETPASSVQTRDRHFNNVPA